MKYPSFLLPAAALAAILPSAHAVSYYINDPLYGNPQNAQFGAKYRLSNNNFDMSLDAGGGTFAGNFIQAGLGNNTLLNTLTWNFSLEHIAGEGYIFEMTRTDSGATTTLSWGSFTSTPPGTTAAVINGETPYTSNGGNPTYYNSLFIEAICNERAAGVQEKLNVSGLAFSSSTLVNGGGSFFNVSLAVPPNQQAFQLVFAEDNLAGHSWLLTGTVSGQANTAAGGDESVKLVIDGKTAQLVPEPGTVAAGLGLGALALGTLIRRRR